jgi:thymidylate synthase
MKVLAENIISGDLNLVDWQYKGIAQFVLRNGSVAKGRNGDMIIAPFYSFTIYPEKHYIPIVGYRKIYYKSAFGELAALLEGVNSVKDFERHNVNYWSKWADENGRLNLDYSNMLRNGQLEYVMDNLRKDIETGETGRKHLVSLWNPENVMNCTLSLECCWESFIFTLIDGKLHMTFRMRSLDIFFGLPYDILIAWTIQMAAAAELGVEQGQLTFSVTNPHIYMDDVDNIKRMLEAKAPIRSARYEYMGESLTGFNEKDIRVYDYLYNDFTFDGEVKA